MKKSLLIITALIAVVFNANAQRYLTPVFTDVNVQSDITYANNVSVLTGTPTPVDLKMDVYTPIGDTLAERPVVIMLHTGSFLPAIFNQSPTGSMRDSSIVEMCSQFARRGYTAISADYRTGWNPQAVGPTGQDIRTGSLLLAVYRALQDIKSCVRYLRMDYEMMGNNYGIDTSKITLGGMGSGGYIALAYATINDTIDFNLPKFISSTTNPAYGFVAGSSYVNTGIWGDIDGLGGTPGFNNENNVGYSNKVHFVFNCGGALGDSSWLNAGNVPMVCIHPITDPFAPFGNGTVIVPTTGDPVVDVSGSEPVMQISTALGNNDCYRNAGLTDPYTTRANQINGGVDGLFPLAFSSPQAGPWEWYDSTRTVQLAVAFGLGATAGTNIYMGALQTNPDMSKAKALAYIDTVQNYVNPRMAICLNLTSTSVTEITASDVTIFPNPATSYFTVNVATLPINSVEVLDLAGRVVYNRAYTNVNEVTIDRNNFAKGVYSVRVNTQAGSVTKKLTIQ